MTTKEQMREVIQDAVSNNQEFGNHIVDIADAWRDAITDRVWKMKKKELEELYEKALEVGK